LGNEQFLSYIMAGTRYILMWLWWWCLLCSRPTHWAGFL